VIRWEKQKGLPIHRVPGGQRQAVFAYRHEIDHWLHKEGIHGDAALSPAQSVALPVTAALEPVVGYATRPRFSKIVGLGVMAAALAIVAGAWVAWFLFRQPSIQIEGIAQLSDDGTAKDGLVTDGSHLYFSEAIGTKHVLASMTVQGGPVHRFEGPPDNPTPVDVSTDGKLVLVLSLEGPSDVHPLWIIPAAGGTPYAVGNARCRSAAWSPDSTWIACATGDEIDLVSPDGATSRRLSQFHGVPEAIHWSEDGKRLTFFLRDQSTFVSSLWQLSLSSNFIAERAVSLDDVREKCCPILSVFRNTDAYIVGSNDPVVGRLLYVRYDPWWHRTRSKISALNTQFGGIAGLVLDANASKLFVISSTRYQGDLVRYDPSTQHFVPFLPGVAATYVDIAARTGRVTYVRPSDSTLWISRADGSAARQVSPPGMEVELPRWSSDGKQIAFMGRERDKPWRIFIVPETGGIPKNASEGTDNQGAPTWSPDGMSLAYGNILCQSDGSCAIHTINLTTGKVETLPHSQGLSTARWSPDGRHIAALDRERHVLYVFDMNRQEWYKVAESANADDVSWSADSAYVYTKRSTQDISMILRIPVGGGAEQIVLDLAPLGKLAGHLDPWFTLAPDGSVITGRWLNTSEIYAVSYSRR